MKNLVLSCTLALATSLVAATAWSADTAPPTDASKSKIVCKTQAQLDQEKQNAKEATNEFQRDGSQQLEKGS